MNQTVISEVHGDEILDSRGNPTVEVVIKDSAGNEAQGKVPSGASTGDREACELRDGDKSRYRGKGVLNAVQNVNTVLRDLLVGQPLTDLAALDRVMIEADGTEYKTKLGANAILGCSIAAAHLAAKASGRPLFELLGGSSAIRLPVPLMNVVNGGEHANNGMEIQEFMLVPHGFNNFRDALRAGCEIFHQLGKDLDASGHSTAVGAEGGYAPNLPNNRAALEVCEKAITGAGYSLDQVGFALDCAASEFFDGKVYQLDGKSVDAGGMVDIINGWRRDFPILSIEDALDQNDWEGWRTMTSAIGDEVQLVGDDLLVTQVRWLSKGIEMGAANAMLVKPNQVGSLSETIAAVEHAHKNGFATVMSHRSGETEDDTIADLSVALDCGMIKTGSASRSDRMAKYNRLLRISRLLGDRQVYGGKLKIA